jgi:pyruvate/2-oxoglutarate dehydrogenase complex dihydrolipoamide acyltransferase (E2) component
VRRLLDEYNINGKDITASGPYGRLLKGDVLAFISTCIQLTLQIFSEII